MKLTSRLAVIVALVLSVGSLSAADKAAKAKKMNPKVSVSAYKIDPAQSQVQWLGKKVTGQHNGTIGIKSGSINVQNNNIVGGAVMLDANTIVDADLEGEWKAKLEGHLKSDDFFGAEKNPLITFAITKVAPAATPSPEATHDVTGMLTIKGKTNPISFPAKVEIKNGTLMASAKNVEVDRTLFDIRYGSGKFFQNLGDKVIDDKFSLDLSIVATK